MTSSPRTRPWGLRVARALKSAKRKVAHEIAPHLVDHRLHRLVFAGCSKRMSTWISTRSIRQHLLEGQGVPGEKLWGDEKHTQDSTSMCTSAVVIPDVKA
ncbi:MAG TPA: hypothetical protein VMF67_10050 [Rhizomicrobium sp.]|nr:hypothetical protein [Rhizomicrobium sp.]